MKCECCGKYCRSTNKCMRCAIKDSRRAKSELNKHKKHFFVEDDVIAEESIKENGKQ